MGLLAATPVQDAQDAVTTETEWVRAEVDAFERFTRRVSQYEPSGCDGEARLRGVATSAGTVVTQRSGTRPSTNSLRQIALDAYEETVLAVEHWECAYGESDTVESLRREFSPEIAAALDGTTDPFPALLRDRLLDQARDSTRRRRDMLVATEKETSQLRSIRSDIRGVIDQIRAAENSEKTFHERTSSLEAATDRLEWIAQSRQEQLDRYPMDGDEFRAIVYGDLETTYPVLSSVATIRTWVDTVKLRLWAGYI